MNSQRRKKLKKILPVATFASSQAEIADKTGVNPATVSRIMATEEYQQMYEQQKQGIVQMAIKRSNEWFNEYVGKKNPRTAQEAAIVWSIMIDKITKLSGEDAKWSSSIQYGDKNIVLKVNDDVKQIMEQIKK